MRLTTILNRVEKYKSFVYGEAKFERAGSGGDASLVVPVRSRKGAKAICSGCGAKCQTYDRAKEARRFEYIPLWGMIVLFAYRMRRVDCRRCHKVLIERVPWCDGKHSQTTSYRWFLARWAKRLSWSEVASIFGTSGDSVCRAVEHAVEWGLAQRSLAGITAIGIDEVAWGRGHLYLTLVYQIGGGIKRLLSIEEHRTEESLRSALSSLGKRVCGRVRFVCSDMWKPYLTVIREQLGSAVHVLDRFHIMQHFGKALDEIRAEESKQLKRDGYEPVLKSSRWCLLKRPENLTDKQTVKLSEIMKYNLRSVRGYLHREEFQRFWTYTRGTWAGKFLDEWTTRVMRSQLEPLKKVARMLRRHRDLLLNWFEAKGTMSSGAVEGLNNKVKLVTRKSYGFRTLRVAKLALFHTLGQLPEPKDGHRFC